MTFLVNDPRLKAPGIGVDFHMHTLASDGSWTPERLVEIAAAQGIRVLSVSDHDTLKSVRKVGELAQARGIQFIPGVEITINWKEAWYHLLLFNYDPENPELNALLADTQHQLVSKNDFIVEELKKQGYRLEKLESYKRPDGYFMAIDIARALYKGGEVRSFDLAISMCLQLGMLDRIASQPADKALQVGLAAGGIPVLAHPGRFEKGFTIPSDETLQLFKEAGMAGLEAYHPSHRPEDVERYLTFARNNNMVVSCGSDSHNDSRRPTPWSPELCREMLERFNVAVPRFQAGAF